MTTNQCYPGVLAVEQEDAYKFNGVKKQFEVVHRLGAYDPRCQFLQAAFPVLMTRVTVLPPDQDHQHAAGDTRQYNPFCWFYLRQN